MEEEIKFCPTCDYQGIDTTCPVCSQKMVSEESEMDRIIREQAKEDKSDLLGEELGLEDLAEKEVDSDIKAVEPDES